MSSVLQSDTVILLYSHPLVPLSVWTGWQEGESGDDLDPVLVSGFGRSSWVSVDGELTGSACNAALLLLAIPVCWLQGVEWKEDR